MSNVRCPSAPKGNSNSLLAKTKTGRQELDRQHKRHQGQFYCVREGKSQNVLKKCLSMSFFLTKLKQTGVLHRVAFTYTSENNYVPLTLMHLHLQVTAKRKLIKDCRNDL